MYRYGFCVLFSLLLVIPPPLPASWGGGFCGPVGFAQTPSLPPAYQWRPIDAEQSALYYGDAQVGVCVLATGDYYTRLAPGQFDGPCPCPADLPPAAVVKKPKAEGCPCCGEDCPCSIKPCGKPGCRCVLSAGRVEADGTPNYGLDLAQMPKEGKHILNGQEVTKDELMQAIGKPQLPHDADQLCVTVIGPEAERKQVLADLDTAPALSPWKGRVKVQGYDPDHWAVKGSGFVTDGHPTIYCQAADGKVLHRQDDYRGPEALAEALRQADPSYQSQKDPDLNKPLNLQSVPTWAWVAGAVLLFLFLKGDK